MEKRLNRHRIGFLIALLIISCSSAFAQQDKGQIRAIEKERIKTISGKYIPTSDLRQFLLDEMDKLDIPGLSLAIVNDGQVVFYENLGLKNLQTMEPVDSSTLFEACSLSKPLFAYFTLLLKEQNVLDLDSPIYTSYMDAAVDYSAPFYYKNLTVRKILNHCSGWVNWREVPGEKLTFRFLPGTQSGYSGEGYQFLKRFMLYRLDASASQLNDYFHQLIVDPLHCSPMDFILTSSAKNRKAFGHIAGSPIHGQTNDQQQFDAAGGLVTNAMAYSRFIIALMNRHDSIANELLTLQTSLPPENDGLFRSLGFPYKKINNKIRYFHSGSNAGTRSYCHFYRKEKIGLVILSNSDNFFASGFAKKILEYLGEPYPY